VRAETVERVARHVLKTDPQEVYGDAYGEAAMHAGRRVDDRDACFDLCFSNVKSGSLFYAGADEATRRSTCSTVVPGRGWCARRDSNPRPAD
jgi:hypothetical protein